MLSLIGVSLYLLLTSSVRFNIHKGLVVASSFVDSTNKKNVNKYIDENLLTQGYTKKRVAKEVCSYLYSQKIERPAMDELTRYLNKEFIKYEASLFKTNHRELTKCNKKGLKDLLKEETTNG